MELGEVNRGRLCHEGRQVVDDVGSHFGLWLERVLRAREVSTDNRDFVRIGTEASTLVVERI